MNPNANTTPHPEGRVIGLDAHPDTFTAAVLRGQIPASAIVEKIFNRVPIGQLKGWAQKHLTPEDTIVLEASGNSFEIVRSLERVDRKALVLESCHLGKLKEAHANNDKISAVRIGKAYLAGTAREVWVPDLITQQRRDWFHSHRKAVKRTTQLRNRLLSYLSDNGVRLKGQEDLLVCENNPAKDPIGKAKDWSPRQWQVIEGMRMELRHAEEQRAYWSSLIAQEVLDDPMLLSIVRLCGVREIVSFALGALIGDIGRFAKPSKLVKYVGLDPAFDDSGEEQWSGGVGGHGRKDLRSLLIEAAQSILRSSHPLAKWGKKLLGRKGEIKLVVAAIARKLVVSVWYLMMGRWNALEEVDVRLRLKIGKIISHLGADRLKKLGKTRKELRETVFQSLKSGRTYRPDPRMDFSHSANPAGLAALSDLESIILNKRGLKGPPVSIRQRQPCAEIPIANSESLKS